MCIQYHVIEVWLGKKGGGKAKGHKMTKSQLYLHRLRRPRPRREEMRGQKRARKELGIQPRQTQTDKYWREKEREINRQTDKQTASGTMGKSIYGTQWRTEDRRGGMARRTSVRIVRVKSERDRDNEEWQRARSITAWPHVSSSVYEGCSLSQRINSHQTPLQKGPGGHWCRPPPHWWLLIVSLTPPCCLPQLEIILDDWVAHSSNWPVTASEGCRKGLNLCCGFALRWGGSDWRGPASHTSDLSP